MFARGFVLDNHKLCFPPSATQLSRQSTTAPLHVSHQVIRKAVSDQSVPFNRAEDLRVNDESCGQKGPDVGEQVEAFKDQGFHKNPDNSKMLNKLFKLGRMSNAADPR